MEKWEIDTPPVFQAVPGEIPPVIALPSSDPSAPREILHWGLALGLTASFLFLQVGFGVITGIVAVLRHRSPAFHPLTLVGQIVLSFLITLTVGAWIGRVPFARLLALGRFPIQAVPAAIFAVPGMWLLALEIGALTELALPVPQAVRRTFGMVFDATTYPFPSFVMLVIVPPLTEEFLCRGILLRSLRARWRPWTAILISAVAFGVLHANPWQLFYAIFIGIIFGWVWEITRSVGICMVMHAANNGIAWALLHFSPEWAGGITGDSGEPTPMLDLKILVGATLVLGLGLWSIRCVGSAPRAENSDPCLNR